MPTLRDVAKAAKVSYSQASFVLNSSNLHLVSQERQQRIRQVMQELNYRPNRQARQVRRGRTNILGLLLSSETGKGTTISAQINGAAKVAQEKGYCLSILRLSDSEIAEGRLPDWVREVSLDGLILHYNKDMPDHIRRAVDQIQLPEVWVNVKKESDCVYVDEVAAGRLAVDTLLARGHRRMLFVHVGEQDTREAEHHSIQDRLRGYEDAMRQARLEPASLMIQSPLFDQMQVLSEQFDRLAQAPTAIITATSGQTAGMRSLMQAKGSPGLDGQPVDIMTYVAALIPTERVWNQVDVIRIPQAQMGAAAVRQALCKIESPGKALEPVVITPQEVFSWRDPNQPDFYGCPETAGCVVGSGLTTSG